MNPNAPCRDLLLAGMPAVAPCARCGAGEADPCRQRTGMLMAARNRLAKPSKTK